MPDDEAWLADIQSAAQDALSYTAGMDRTAFLADRKTRLSYSSSLSVKLQARCHRKPEPDYPTFRLPKLCGCETDSCIITSRSIWIWSGMSSSRISNLCSKPLRSTSWRRVSHDAGVMIEMPSTPPAGLLSLRRPI